MAMICTLWSIQVVRGADIVTLNQARERALEYRRMAKQGLNPRFNAHKEVPTFEEVAQQVHVDRMPTWKNQKHGQRWINTLRDYAFPKIGRTPIDSIDQPEVLMCLSPIWTEKHETARRLSQRIKIVLDVAKSKGLRSGENPVTATKDAQVLPKVKAKPKHHMAMRWQDVPAFYADLTSRNAMSARELCFTCLTGSRTNEVLGMRWPEIDFDEWLWTCPEERMKTGEVHRVPLTDEMLAIIEPLRDRDKLAKWGHKGMGPAYYRLGRKIVYRGCDLNQWVEAHRVDPNAGGK